MPEVKSWDEIATEETQRSNQPRKGGNTIRNLKMVGGRAYILRFVGEPVKFFKYWVAGKSAICANPDTCPVHNKYGIDPSTKYASNVILRSIEDFDGNVIEDKDHPEGVLFKWEFPPAATKPIIAWKRARKQEPGGENGCDFRVEVTGTGKEIRYTPTPLDITPFTADEKKMIDAESYNLVKLYKAVPEVEIEARLFGGDAKPATAAPAQRQQPVGAGAAAKGGLSSDNPPF
jgi:hypothetical protein